MSATPIPTRSRERLKARSQGRCERCGMTATDAHHRRSRSVRDEHTHDLCNLVHLCRIDHAWVHANPSEARKEGFIVRREHDPRMVPFQRWDGALITANCDGTVTFLDGTYPV